VTSCPWWFKNLGHTPTAEIFFHDEPISASTTSNDRTNQKYEISIKVLAVQTRPARNLVNLQARQKQPRH
jgi:hypothetical protein